jgi:hypothetical protein
MTFLLAWDGNARHAADYRTAVLGTFETSRDVRNSVVIGGKADMAVTSCRLPKMTRIARAMPVDAVVAPLLAAT